MMADQDVGKVVKQRRTGDLHILNKFLAIAFIQNELKVVTLFGE